MTDHARQADEELSMFAIGAKLLRHRWRIARWVILGGALAAISVIGKPALYRASASFAPQGGNDASRSGLASLAGQFGVSLPGSSQALSPEYYVKLLRSHTMMRQIVNDTFTVAEMSGKRIAFLDLFEINGPSSLHREDRGVLVLSQIVGPSVSKATGIVELSATTKWRSVSLAIVDSLVAAVNDFNQRSRQSQAATERKFVEGRLDVAAKDLAEAEELLDEFYKSNRVFSGSPDLVTRRDRLQRVVEQRQQLFNTLSQSYEETRLREVRDTPVITVIEAPWAPALPEPRGRTKVGLLGVMIGGFIGVFIVLTSDLMSRRLVANDPDAVDFMTQLRAFGSDLRNPRRLLASLFGRTHST